MLSLKNSSKNFQNNNKKQKNEHIELKAKGSKILGPWRSPSGPALPTSVLSFNIYRKVL